MATITEDYVSFETAKLLKEKGFDEPIQYFYKFDSKELYRGTVFTNTQIGDKFYNAPTLQMAMKWLREEHNLFIWVGYNGSKGLPFYYEIRNMQDNSVVHIGGICAGTYELVVEAAIKYCLENLI